MNYHRFLGMPVYESPALSMPTRTPKAPKPRKPEVMEVRIDRFLDRLGLTKVIDWNPCNTDVSLLEVESPTVGYVFDRNALGIGWGHGLIIPSGASAAIFAGTTA